MRSYEFLKFKLNRRLMRVSQRNCSLRTERERPSIPTIKKLIFFEFLNAIITWLGCRTTAIKVWPRSREVSLSSGTCPLAMHLFFRVHENRIFIMSDFRDFFHALHHAPISICQFLISRPFEIEPWELLIFKRVPGNTRFSPYFAFFFWWNSAEEPESLGWILFFFSSQPPPADALSLYWYPRT